ncbi:hypothetical protein GALMADRAFT_144696 [Galerina marginata CBS 339.88]|uniref:F-box domain-containing protein n=1 Tax=Galerina marginata (strain CBS 339.88) TaxID=685588 RepID=A0A067SK70_GALM3|nr:hypothetical protein GALMADRAFT_144696 [Galerina marginata CBS 339.88]
MTSNAVYLPTEIIELVVDELDIDESSDNAQSSRAALRSCLLVSWQFHQRASRHLFRNIEFHDVNGPIHFFRDRLLLLRRILTTSINNYHSGIASNIRKLVISVPLEDDEEESDNETEHVGGEENSIASVIAKHFPPILKLIRQDAYRLENLVIENRSDWKRCVWDLLPLDLHLAFRGLLWMPTLRRLELRNFVRVPNNLFDCIHVTHLIVEELYPMDEELDFDESDPVLPVHEEFTFGPLEFLESDQCFPLQKIVDISPHQSSKTTKTKLLKNIKLEIHDKDHFNKVVYLLRAAYLAEDLHLNFMKLVNLQSNPFPKVNLDLFPLQKLTHLTMSFDDDLYGSSPESGPKSLKIAYSILNTRSCSIIHLTVTFKWHHGRAPNYLIYPRREHWEPFDNILAGPHYPNLCLLALRISLQYPISEDCRSRFKAALPLLSASNRLDLYLM